MPTANTGPLPLLVEEQPVTSQYADACGNTFLIYDLLAHDLKEPWEEVRGKVWDILKTQKVDDALVLRRIASSPGHLVVKMHVLEPDRTEADFCGNGARSVGLYLYRKYGEKYHKISLSSKNGLHDVLIQNGTCFIKMGKPTIDKGLYIYSYKGKEIRFKFVDAVEPHLVTADFYDEKTLHEVGEAINRDWRLQYPQGVNVNCMQRVDGSGISVMTYERGVYRLTKACGTGSTSCLAVAIDSSMVSKVPSYKIQVLGGVLEMLCSGSSGDIWLGGPVLLP